MILPDKNIRPLELQQTEKNPILSKFRHVQACLEKDFFGENMILPSCKIQYTKTNRKWKKKSKKTRIFQGICLGFLPASFEKQNPPTPSIELKRKQEKTKPAFRDSF